MDLTKSLKVFLGPVRANQLCRASYTKSFERRQQLRRSARRCAVTEEAIRFTTLYALAQAEMWQDH